MVPLPAASFSGPSHFKDCIVPKISPFQPYFRDATFRQPGARLLVSFSRNYLLRHNAGGYLPDIRAVTHYSMGEFPQGILRNSLIYSKVSRPVNLGSPIEYFVPLFLCQKCRSMSKRTRADNKERREDVAQTESIMTNTICTLLRCTESKHPKPDNRYASPAKLTPGPLLHEQ